MYAYIHIYEYMYKLLIDQHILQLPHHRNPETVDMDEMMAAMVLTSLSCSPVIQNSAQGNGTPGTTLYISYIIHF